MLDYLLSKGCVFAGRFKCIDHEKYFIVLGVSKDKESCCSVFINSKIPRYIQNNYAALSLQVNIRGEKYGFLTHDSFISCGSIQKHAISDLYKCRYLGKIDEDDLWNALNTIKNSDVLTEMERDLYFYDFVC